MFGAIVGDVIGSPFEQCNVKSTSFRLFDRGASRIIIRLRTGT